MGCRTHPDAPDRGGCSRRAGRVPGPGRPGCDFPGSPAPGGRSVTAFLDSLNREQREAVEHFQGPSLVLAGAGSGKTRVLTTRVWHLIIEHGVPADRIMAVTFTNKAAGEMRERVAAMLDGQRAGAWIGTFHAIGAR
ncbi:MAG: AAA family ATPase, partial [Gemmatimonadetes bacterium]|nr:AAA family ATPase [Gemmatimonadota bacterium]